MNGVVKVPGDKSVTHRTVLFGSIAEGVTEITTETLGRDNMATIRIAGQLGVQVEGELAAPLMPIAAEEGLTQFSASTDGVSRLRVHGRGLQGLTAPLAPLDCGNSGTTARLLCGMLAAQDFESTLTGDASLSKRPFKRVAEPLAKMGAKFSGDRLPLTVRGARADSKISGIHFDSPQASAQVKSAILLAGLLSNDEVKVTEPHLSRDHTERMFRAMGVELETGQDPSGRPFVALPKTTAPRKLRAAQIEVPRDFSAAAFFLVAGSIFPDSNVLLPAVGVNKTRVGLLHVLRRMGALISYENERDVCGEPVADLRVKTARLMGIDVTPEEVVLAIDEVPVLAIAAAVAHGTTRITGAAELRVKESDRLATTAAILKGAGVEVEELEDGLIITGKGGPEGLSTPPLDASWRKSGDHRIAMCGAIVDLLSGGSFVLQDKEAVETSFPGFVECFQGIF